MAGMNVTENDFLSSQYSCFNAPLNFFIVLNEKRKKKQKKKEKKTKTREIRIRKTQNRREMELNVKNTPRTQ